ncbi:MULTISPECIES: DNA repair exonuclease [unclassified Virgibacillus]|uniref:metallophosphoesterase family protein n=1 Tax=unclassified Virgibacillus TaxID=2620237 RepID=UPI00090B86D0|nr:MULTISPECIES: DNA repair exonuclease [unclassified Virgibacillus]API91092.1 DNA repair exonuclease [Virgibacillus sp. 6R]MBS7429083.1 DNA repair exonuclease [Virgibacillus sp. 19R1-5]
MTKEITFLHAADLHLDSPFKGLASAPEDIFKDIRKSTFTALDNLVKAAIQHHVDFVLLVGDLFDNEQQSLQAQIRLKRAFETLQQHGITVFLSYGNHDHLNGNAHSVPYPDNVIEFKEGAVTSYTYVKHDEPLAVIYGFSYQERAVQNNKTSEYQITDLSVPFHIGMLHGSVQSNTDHDTYAPFKISDLTGVDMDYWALGHIHRQQVLKQTPPIIYPGNTQGRHRKETGEKGCYHVRLTKEKAELEFFPLHAIQISHFSLDLTSCPSVFEMEREILNSLEQHKAATSQLVDLTLASKGDRIKEWDRSGDVEEVIALVNETLTQPKNWVYIFHHQVQTQIVIDESLYQGQHFIGEMLREADKLTVQPLLTDLYQQKQARKFLQPLTIEEEHEITAAAKELLVHELLKE